MDPDRFGNLDPDLADLVRAVPEGTDALADIPAARAYLASLVGMVPETPDLEITDLALTAYDSPAWMRVFRPREATGPLPAILHLHGGGFCLGSVEMEHATSARLARDVGAVVACVEYRLAPEHPYPAGLDDCYAALRMLTELDGVDPDRVAVHGSSAGGGLAAAVTLLARDRSGPPICFQSLAIPALDDRLETPSMRAYVDTPMWSRPQAARSWELYLAGRPADAYAAPARTEDLSGLPPAYVTVAELDPLRDEGIDYAARLLRAGVSTELHAYPGTVHGSELAHDAPVVRRMHEELVGVLRRALAPRPPHSER